MVEDEIPSSSRAVKASRGKEIRRNDLLNTNSLVGATRTYARRRPPVEGVQGENSKDGSHGTSVCDPPPDLEFVFSSNLCWPGAHSPFDPAVFEASLSGQVSGDPKAPSVRLSVQEGELSSALLSSEMYLAQDSSYNQGGGLIGRRLQLWSGLWQG